MDYISAADVTRGLLCSTTKYKIVGQKKELRVSLAGNHGKENVASAPATPADNMNISVLDLKWDNTKQISSVPQKRRTRAGSD